MKSIINKENYAIGLKNEEAKKNLLEICGWFNFLEDDMKVRFHGNSIVLRTTFDNFVSDKYRYTNNGIIFGGGVSPKYHHLPARDGWLCYYTCDVNKVPKYFVYINKEMDIFNSFEFNNMITAPISKLMTIDMRTYDGR